LIPLVIAIACLLARQRSFIWWLGCILLTVAAVNVFFVGAYSTWHEWKYARETRRCLREISAFRQPIVAYVGPFLGLRQRLRETGAEVRTLESPSMVQADSTRRLIPSPGQQAFWLR
jgi:hypothetical protein